MRLSGAETRKVNAFIAKLLTGNTYAVDVFSDEENVRKKAIDEPLDLKGEGNNVLTKRVRAILYEYPKEIRALKTSKERKKALNDWVVVQFDMRSPMRRSD